MTSAIKVLETAVANYTCSAWESSHTFSFTAALAMHTINISPGSMHIQDLCFALYDLTLPMLAVAIFIFHGKLYVNTCSVELPAGDVHAMNNNITKWRIALSINNTGMLENHSSIVRALR